jgi:hypothetical protein
MYECVKTVNFSTLATLAICDSFSESRRSGIGQLVRGPI